MSVTRDEVFSVYRAFFGYDPEAAVVEQWQASGDDLESLLQSCLDSVAPTRPNDVRGYQKSQEYLEHNGPRFGAPRELQVTPTPLKRVLLVGQCLLAAWPLRLKSLGVTAEIDHVLLSVNEPPVIPRPADVYSFQVTAIGNRFLINDTEMFEWCRSGYGNPAFGDALVDRARRRIDRALKVGTMLRDQLPIFVTNIVRPQQELNGRLINRSTNDSIFVVYEKINAYLRDAVAQLENVYILDVVEIVATIGRKHLLDDAIMVSTHASVLSNGLSREDAKRISPPRKPTEYYEVKMDPFLLAVWCEAEAMYRSLQQIDQVKMVCVDLDDTLWRGNLAEDDLEDIDANAAIEGWPSGVAEALAVLRRRGILLCIVSKNSEPRVRAIFEKVYRNRLRLEDFAIVKINWRPKAENIREAMAEAGLLPRSVVFLDDNPLEQFAIKQAFPDIRVVEAPIYYWRRILLWSAEMQSAAITDESVRRTEMVQAQVQREAYGEQLNYDEFLAGLGLRVTVSRVPGEGKRFLRALELLNKSNQFNTNGQRWTAQKLAAMSENGFIVAAAVSDNFTDYGDTLVAVLRGNQIEQLVMSCRIIGLGVELAVVAAVARRVLATHPRIVAAIVETDANALARDLFARSGWTFADGNWSSASAPRTPSHIVLTGAI